MTLTSQLKNNSISITIGSSALPHSVTFDVKLPLYLKLLHKKLMLFTAKKVSVFGVIQVLILAHSDRIRRDTEYHPVIILP